MSPEFARWRVCFYIALEQSQYYLIVSEAESDAHYILKLHLKTLWKITLLSFHFTFLPFVVVFHINSRYNTQPCGYNKCLGVWIVFQGPVLKYIID